MPDLTLVSEFPPWDISYSYSVRSSLVGASRLMGGRDQARVSQKEVVIARVSRMLRGDKLAYFEYFIRGVCNDGQLSFTDKYKDGSGVTSGEVRLVDGAYSVKYDNTYFRVTCDIEVFRGA